MAQLQHAVQSARQLSCGPAQPASVVTEAAHLLVGKGYDAQGVEDAQQQAHRVRHKQKRVPQRHAIPQPARAVGEDDREDEGVELL